MKGLFIFLVLLAFTSCQEYHDEPALKMDVIGTIGCVIASHKVRQQIINIMNAWETKDIYTIFGAIVHALPDFKSEVIRCLANPDSVGILEVVKVLKGLMH